MSRKIHLISMRLRNNAGIEFPLCYANAKLLDTDKVYLPMTPKLEYVTCKHCRNRSLPV